MIVTAMPFQNEEGKFIENLSLLMNGRKGRLERLEALMYLE